MLLEHSELTAHSNEIPQEQPTPENCFLLIPGIGKGGENDTQEGMDIHTAEYAKYPPPGTPPHCCVKMELVLDGFINVCILGFVHFRYRLTAIFSVSRYCLEERLQELFENLFHHHTYKTENCKCLRCYLSL